MLEPTDVLLVLAKDTLLDEQLEQQVESKYKIIFGLDFPLGILTLVPALSVMMMMMMGWDGMIN